MASNFKLNIEGEAEFKKALKEIDAEIKLNKSELQLLAAQYNGSDDALANLTARQSELGDSIKLQTDKVSLMNDALQKATEQYGEQDARVVKLRTEYVNAQTALEKLNSEYKAGEEAIQTQREAMAAAENDTTDQRKAIEQLDSALAADKATLEKLSVQYGDSGKSSEALKQKVGVLSSSVETQQKKVETLREALAKTETQYGENSTEANKYREELTKSETELTKMSGELDKSKTKLDGQFDGAVDSSEDLRGVLGEITDMTGIQLPNELTGLIGNFGSVTTAAGGIAAAIGTAISKMEELSSKSAAYADDINTKSSITGIDSETMQEFEYMSDVLDTSYETLATGLKNLKLKMVDARDGNVELRNSFDELNVRVIDSNGEMRNAYDVFLDVIDALGDVDNETERDAAAMQLMGKSASDLNPLIDAGSEKLDYYRQMAHDAGAVMSEDMLSAMGDVQDRADILNKNWEAYCKNMGTTWSTFKKLFTGKSTWDQYLAADDMVGKSLKSWLKSLFGISYARGTYNHPGGYAVVGEEGPEIVNLPGGSQVYPNGTFPSGAGGGSAVYNITIDAKNIKEFNDIIRVAQSQKQSSRMGYTGG